MESNDIELEVIMHQAIYEELMRVAKGQRLTNYGDIAPLARLDMRNPVDRNEIGRILDEISNAEHQQSRPLLSAVVVQKEFNIPGKGFFALARRLDLYSGHDDLSDVAFWASEVTKVHAAWR